MGRHSLLRQMVFSGLPVMLCAAVASAGQDDIVNLTGRISRSLSLSPRSRLLVASDVHRVSILPASSGEFRVEIVTEVSGSQEQAVRLLASFQPSIKSRHGRVAVDLRLDRSQRRLLGDLTMSGVLRLEVPGGIPVTVNSRNGAGIELAGDLPESSVAAETDAGAILVTGSAGSLQLTSSSGGITVRSKRPLPTVEAVTDSGAVEIASTVDRLSVRSATGEVRLEQMPVRGTASTSEGRIQARLSELPPGRELELRSAHGPLLVELPTGSLIRGTVEADPSQVQSDIELAWNEDGTARFPDVPEGSEAAILRLATAGPVRISLAP